MKPAIRRRKLRPRAPHEKEPKKSVGFPGSPARALQKKKKKKNLLQPACPELENTLRIQRGEEWRGRCVSRQIRKWKSLLVPRFPGREIAGDEVSRREERESPRDFGRCFPQTGGKKCLLASSLCGLVLSFIFYFFFFQAVFCCI